MAVETWSPQANLLALNQKPEGDGWALTGYKEVRQPNPKFGSGYQTLKVPIYTRQAAPTPEPVATTPPAEKPAPVETPVTAGQQQQQVNQQRVNEFNQQRSAGGMNQQGAGQSDVASMLQDLLVSQQQMFQQQLDQARQSASEMQQMFQQQLGAANQAYAAQQQQFAQAQELSQQQLASMQTMYQEQQRQTEALKTAYVPSLEPTAQAPSLGDSRTQTTRSSAANSLSNLSIISDPSSTMNPLIGLQIA